MKGKEIMKEKIIKVGKQFKRMFTMSEIVGKNTAEFKKLMVSAIGENAENAKRKIKEKENESTG